MRPNNKKSAAFSFRIIDLTCLLLIFVFASFTSPKEDSLRNALKKANNRGRVGIYNQLSSIYHKISLDTAMLFAEKALLLANEIQDEEGKAGAFLQKGKIFLIEGRYDSAQEVSRMALDIYSRNNDRRGMAIAYNMMGNSHLWQSRLRAADSIFFISLQLFIQLEDHAGQSAVYKSLGNLNMMQNRFSEALESYLAGCRISEMTGDDALTSSFYTNIGTIYHQRGNFENALKYYYKSLALKEKLNDATSQASLLNNIGLLYTSQSKYIEALEFHRKSLKLDEAIGSEVDIATDLNNLGNVHLQMRNYDSAKNFFLVSLAIRENLGIMRDIAHSLENLGAVHAAKEEYREAVNYYKQSLEINESLGDTKRISLNYINLGQAYTYLNLYDEAEKILLAGLAMREDAGDYLGTSPALSSLAILYESKGDYRRSLDFYKRHIGVRDSLFNESRQKQVMELQTIYETEKKEQELALQNQRLALLQQRSQIDSLWRNGLIAGVILLIAAIIMVYRYQRLRNIQKQQALETQKALTAQLKEVDRMKSRFFANISHEFRTPLTLIIGPAETLQQEPLQEHMKEKLQVIQRSALRLHKLINQLLSLSKLEAGKMELRASQHDMVSFLRRIMNAFESVAERKRIGFDFYQSESEILAFFDAEKMEQIFNNLLSNAFKFTGSNGKVSVSITHSEWNGLPMIKISVKDTGMGISEYQLPYIFDRFYQADVSDTKEYEGTGIGLAIAKELVELHKGMITVSSIKGKGTTFDIYLPTGSGHLREEEIVMTASQDIISSRLDLDDQMDAIEDDSIHKNGPKPMALIVEDHVDLREYIRGAIRDDCVVKYAVDGKEGLEKALELTPDLIISDIMMPKMNGIKLCKTIKSDIRTSHIPVILLTAKSTEEDKLLGLENQADDYLTKPFNTKELALRVKNLIEARRRLQEKFQGSVIVKPKEIEVNSMEQAFLEKLMELLEEHIAEETFGVEELSREIGISRAHLHRKLLALANLSPSRFIRNFRLQRAMDLLQKNAGNIAEVGYLVGFSSPTYFSKCFSEYFGYPPKAVKTLVNPREIK